ARSISPSLARDSGFRRRSSGSVYRSTNFLSAQACDTAASEASRQRSTNSRFCTEELNALSRAPFKRGAEEAGADLASVERFEAPSRSTVPGDVIESWTFGKPLSNVRIDAARSMELTVPLTAMPLGVLAISRSSPKSHWWVNIVYRSPNSVSLRSTGNSEAISG